MLTEISAYSKPVEMQRVSTCLQAFSNETLLASNLQLDLENNNETVNLLPILLNFRK